MKLCKQIVRKQRSLAKTARRIAFASALLGLVSTASAQSPMPIEQSGRTSGLAPIVSATNVPQPAANAQDAVPARLGDRGNSLRHTNPPKTIALAAAQSRVGNASGYGDDSYTPDDGGSLIDIDIPIPGVPQPGTARRQNIKPMHQTVVIEGAGRLNDGVQSSRRRSPDAEPVNRYVIADTSMAPEVLPRDQTMRIKIEPVPVPVNDSAEHIESYDQDSVVSAAAAPTFDDPASPTTEVSDSQYYHADTNMTAEQQISQPVTVDATALPTQTVSDATEPSPSDRYEIEQYEVEQTTAVNETYVETGSVRQMTSIPDHRPEVYEPATPQNEVNSNELAVQASEPAPADLDIAIPTQPSVESRPIPPSPSFVIAEESNYQDQTAGPVPTAAIEHASGQAAPSALPDISSAQRRTAHISALPTGQVTPAVPVQGMHATGSVAHSQVSYEIENSASEPAAISADGVQPVGEFEGNQVITGESLGLRREDVTSFSTKSPILEYSVEHPGICKMIRINENTVSVIGLRDGNTRVAVVTGDTRGNQVIEIREVQVAGGNTTESGLQSVAQEMSQTISKLYPQSRVRVISGEEKLWVRGLVASESDARKILSLVRKMTLTPVVDQLRAAHK